MPRPATHIGHGDCFAGDRLVLKLYLTLSWDATTSTHGSRRATEEHAKEHGDIIGKGGPFSGVAA